MDTEHFVTAPLAAPAVANNHCHLGVQTLFLVYMDMYKRRIGMLGSYVSIDI